MTRTFIIWGLVAGWIWITPHPVAAADPVGTWAYSTSASWSKGPCPTGGDAKGTIKISKADKQLKLVFVSGRTCRPKSMCTFTGKASGKAVTFSNAAKVDNEGGKVKNTIKLTVANAKSASGTSASSYSHPSGMSCKWGSKIALSKK